MKITLNNDNVELIIPIKRALCIRKALLAYYEPLIKEIQDEHFQSEAANMLHIAEIIETQIAN